jgi:VWFA-related protein
MTMKKRLYQIFISLLVIFALSGFVEVRAQSKTKQIAVKNDNVTILVTAMPHNQKQREIAAKLQNSDFDVLENKRSQKIISVKNPTEAPINLAVVVQDNLDWRVNNEIKTLKEFIHGLPEGSRVMTAYITIGGAIVTQELTTDRRQAADSLRIIRGSSFPLNFSPFDGVRTVLKHFDEAATGRRMILVVSDGLDLSLGYRGASPYFSISLDKAIRDAQRLGVAVYTIYAPSEDRRPFGRFGRNYGQSSLIRLSDETGGESFATGVDLVTFDPYLEDFKEMFSRQWLITYRSSTVGTGFRRIEVKTDFDIHLHHPSGYEPKK